MSSRYFRAMRLRPSFVLFSAALLYLASGAAAQDRNASAVPDRAAVNATAGARIVERPVRIVAAELRLSTRSLPAQAQVTSRPCDPGALPGCRMIVVDLP